MSIKSLCLSIAGLGILSVILGCTQRKSVLVPATQEVIGAELIIVPPDAIIPPAGMVWVSGRTFIQGAKDGDIYAMPGEKPHHKVTVDGFFMDSTEVTNRAFQEFVDATGYLTIAERPIDWELMKKDLPAGTPKPPDSILQPGSLVFKKDVASVAHLNDYSQWWEWVIGANWKHPQGPQSTIIGKDDYPVVHIAYDDAIAYCKWKKRRLPTEAEWEMAAQGTNDNTIYTWGNDPDLLKANANTWQGTFPIESTEADGHQYVAPVQSYPPNSVGLYDMIGNVWEWTVDVYDPRYYGTIPSDKPLRNPKGVQLDTNSYKKYPVEMVMKGGSYLCNASYCASYRISARMSTTRDSGSDHLGFRTVVSIAELLEQ